MLVLTRKVGESLYIGEARVTVLDVRGDKVRIGIEAPAAVEIAREEIRPMTRHAAIDKRAEARRELTPNEIMPSA